MKVIFLDRDGVINKYPGDFLYVTSWESFSFLPHVKPALKKLNACGFKIFVISNQAGVSKGVYSQSALDLITRNMLQDLKKHEIKIEGVFYCTHHPNDNCGCRKPKAGLLHKAIAKLKETGSDIDISKSYFIGDTQRDIQAGKSIGLKTILVFSGKEKPGNRDHWEYLPDTTARDLREAVKIITRASAT
jgi:D-glycero-D-manno-heptose 1,7-bisphosphate phosphatase